MTEKQRKRHLHTVFLVGIFTGAIVGSLATGFVSPYYVVSTSAIVIGVVTLVSPPYQEAYSVE